MSIPILMVLLILLAWITAGAHRIFSDDGLLPCGTVTGWLLSLIPAALCTLAALLTGAFTAVIIALHLVGLTILLDAVLFLLRSRFSSGVRRRSWAFLAAFVLCAVYMTGAFINAYSVRCTQYSIVTQKDMGREHLRIAQISDCHLGVTLDGEGLARQLERIEQYRPDVLVVTGDIIDSGTSRSDMLEACEALGEFDAPLGVYFVFGNHDTGGRDFSFAELSDALTRSGITVLADEAVCVDGSFYICGRLDAYIGGRKSISHLLEPLDSGKYIIVLDHQPRDYSACESAGADLVLSGHTHGGQLFPLMLFLEPIGFCESVYGHSVGEMGTDYIVTSGIGGLKAPLRTGTPTEFVIVDITADQ